MTNTWSLTLSIFPFSVKFLQFMTNAKEKQYVCPSLNVLKEKQQYGKPNLQIILHVNFHLIDITIIFLNSGPWYIYKVFWLVFCFL